jgi:hypothetical protein
MGIVAECYVFATGAPAESDILRYRLEGVDWPHVETVQADTPMFTVQTSDLVKPL